MLENTVIYVYNISVSFKYWSNFYTIFCYLGELSKSHNNWKFVQETCLTYDKKMKSIFFATTGETA